METRWANVLLLDETVSLIFVPLKEPLNLVMVNMLVLVLEEVLASSKSSFLVNMSLFFSLASMATIRACLVYLDSSSKLSASSP
jgi:hypothetical protein